MSRSRRGPWVAARPLRHVGGERGGREGVGSEPSSPKGGKSRTPALDSFGRDLTEETAAIANRGIETTNEIIARMRTQAVLRNLAERVADDEAQGSS